MAGSKGTDTIESIKKSQKGLNMQGVTPTHLIMKATNDIKKELKVPGNKHIVNLECQELIFKGNLMGMDVYEDKRLKDKVAYLLDFSVVSNNDEKPPFIKAYEALRVNNPKSACEIYNVF